jgi:hypothetical protein
MRNSRIIVLFVLATTLVVFSISASADEKLNPQQTSLGNTSVGGYVNTTVTSQRTHGFGERLHTFFSSFWLAWWEGPDSNSEF